jgi:acyl-CoA-binding protein
MTISKVDFQKEDHPMIELLPHRSAKTLGFKLTGRLHDEDYRKFVPLVDEVAAKEGRVRLLAQFHEFHGWDLHALWDDIKFASTHCRSIERVALVGDRKWEAWMTKVCKPFTMAKIRYFDVSEIDEAWKWLEEAG